ncbi:MAG: lytic transglycosylase domain-containing protein [Gemmatimonadota bacterium]
MAARKSLDVLRQNPVRNGLIGLAVAGTAAPIAVHHYQEALRTDPSHERGGFLGATSAAPNEGTLSRTWQGLESSAAASEAAREDAIQVGLDQYREYGLTRELAEEIYDMAAANEIPAEVAYGLVRAESSFRNTSTSPVGAVGLTQLMPRTAEWLEPGVTRNQLRDPATNLRIGFSYLRQLIDKYEGDTSLALLAYNRGPGTVDRALRSGQNPDNGYADFVFGREGHGHSLYTNR